MIALLNEGGTVPFIAHYRKEEATGNLDEVQISKIDVKLDYFRERFTTIQYDVPDGGKSE